MHNSRTKFAANLRKVLEMTEKRIHQRAAIADLITCACARMHQHSRGFVHYGKRAIVVKDLERDIFRLRAKWWQLDLVRQLDFVAGLNGVGGFLLSAVDLHLLLPDELLHTSAAHLGNRSGKKLVETLSPLVDSCDENLSRCARFSFG